MGYISPDHILFTTAVSSRETTASWENCWPLLNDIHYTFSIFPVMLSVLTKKQEK